MSLIKPTEVTIKDLDGVERTYRVGRFPALIGLDILAQIPSNFSTLAKQTQRLSQLAVQMCPYAAVDVPLDEGGSHEVMLSTAALIDNHVPDSQTLALLCFAIARHNTDFFGSGDQSFLDFLSEKLVDLLPKIIQMLTESLPSLFPKDSQH